MENRALFIAYLVTWLVYVAGIHGYALWKRINQAVVAISHVVPSLVAALMTYIFLIGHGATVRQFVAYSERGTDMWSVWVGLWPILLCATFGAGVVQAILAIFVAAKPERRAWLPVAALSTGMCAFAFMTVIANFPDA